MKRVIGVDPLNCLSCATPMVILAFISDLEVVHKILGHLQIRTDVAPAPLAHGPWPRQTALDTFEIEPASTPATNSSARGTTAQTSTWGAPGPPSGRA